MLVIFLYTIFVVIVDVLFFFFFKQKTAYELRISDWSSDVCSSDLLSSCSLMMPSQAVLQAPVEPGMQNISVLLAAPAKASDCKVELPISRKDRCLNSSPKPVMT